MNEVTPDYQDVLFKKGFGGIIREAEQHIAALDITTPKDEEKRDFYESVLLTSRGMPSVAAEGFQAPGVVVSYTTDPDIQSGKAFIAQGLQTAAGVPLMCDEPSDFRTFRLGLFGLDKWADVDRSVGQLSKALDAIGVNAINKEAVSA